MTIDRQVIEKKINSIEDKREQIELCFHYYDELRMVNNNLAMEFAERGRLLSLELGYDDGLARALAAKAYRLRREGMVEDALESYSEALVIAGKDSIKNSYLLNRIMAERGACYTILGDYNMAAALYSTALNQAEKAGDLEGKALIYSNLASLNGTLKKFDFSIEYSHKAIKLLKKVKNYKACITAYNNLATTCNLKGSNDESLRYIEKAMRLIEENGLEEFYALLYLTEGEVYHSKGELEEAKKSMLKALEVAKKSKMNWELISIYINLGAIFREDGDYKEALKYLKMALSLAEKNANSSCLKRAHEELYNFYEQHNRFKKALYHYQEFFELEKRSFDLEMDKNIKNIESESLRRANERIKIISRIGQRITATLDMRAVLNSVYESVNSLMDAAIFAIVEYNEESGRISYDLSMENGEPLPPIYFNVDTKNSMTALAIREKREIIINDVDNELKFYFEDEPYKYKVQGLNDKQGPQSMMFIPLIIEERVTGLISVQSFEKNAYSLTDFDALKVLGSYVAVALNNARQATMISEQNKRLKELAITDALTGTYNRREFEKRLTELWNLSRGDERAFSIILLDADHFKEINDTYGHLAGDECLRVLASILKGTIHTEGTCIARYGGEEFIILVNFPLEKALELAEELRREVEEFNLKFEEQVIAFTISIGVSSAVLSELKCERGAEQLISKADEALYQAKEEGRNRVKAAK